MYTTIRVHLKPNNKQKTKLELYSNAAKFIYNWTLEKQLKHYAETKRFLKNGDLRKELTVLKRTEEFKWLQDVDNNVPKQAIKDCCEVFLNYYNGNIAKPKFKNSNSKKSFYQDPLKLKITESYIKVAKFAKNTKANKQKLNWIRLGEKVNVPKDTPLCNPRIIYDGKYWYFTVSFLQESLVNAKQNNKGIGIDLGVKNLAICSDGVTYSNINKSGTVCKLKDKIKHTQRKIQRKYFINNKNQPFTKGRKLHKTSNISKLDKYLKDLYKRLYNIRVNYLHQATANIIKNNPKFIVLEDISIKGIIKNNKYSKYILEQNWHKFRWYIEYKCLKNNIQFILADKWFPSTKKCIKCGNIKEFIHIKERDYICYSCGNIIDRDIQASLNLEEYGEKQLTLVNKNIPIR